MFNLRLFILNAFLPALCVLGIAYNFLIALNGPEGVRAGKLVEERLNAKQAELIQIQEYRESLENKASLFSRQNLDLDLLDESARRLLGYADSAEQVISIDELEKVFLPIGVQ